MFASSLPTMLLAKGFYFVILIGSVRSQAEVEAMDVDFATPTKQLGFRQNPTPEKVSQKADSTDQSGNGADSSIQCDKQIRSGNEVISTTQPRNEANSIIQPGNQAESGPSPAPMGRGGTRAKQSKEDHYGRDWLCMIPACGPQTEFRLWADYIPRLGKSGQV